MKSEGMFVGRDIVQKEFHDCKGETFDRLLCQFSSAVIVKVTKRVTLAQRVANAPTPSKVEQKSLLPLAIAHHASLSNLLKKKKSLRRTFSQMENSLATKEAELHSQIQTLGRVEKIPEKIDARATEQHAREVAELTKQFDTHWEGDPKWKEIILEGSKIQIPDDFFDHPFSKRERPVVGSVHDDTSASNQPNLRENLDKRVGAQQEKLEPNLLEDLDKRLTAQEARLERWKIFRKELNSSAPNDGKDPESIKHSGDEPRRGNFDGPKRGTFDGPRRGTFGGPSRGTSDGLRRTTLDGPSPCPGAVTEKVESYEKLMEIINKNLKDVHHPSKVTLDLEQGKPATLVIQGQSGYSVTCNLSEKKPNGAVAETSEGNREMANPHAPLSQAGPHVHRNEKSQSCAQGAALCSKGPQTDREAANVLPPEKKFSLVQETSDILPEQLARLTISGPSSPPKVPAPPKYQSSLVERTRESMALAKVEDRNESSISQAEDVPTLPIRAPGSLPSGSNLKLTGSETLVERTRKSMSLLPVKSRAPRTSLLKKPSKVYPTNPFGTPKKSHDDMPGISTPPEELFSQNAKYASVFKSRPKIALSPAQSPSVSFMDVVYESEHGSFREDNGGEGTSSSPPRNARRVLDGAKFVSP